MYNLIAIETTESISEWAEEVDDSYKGPRSQSAREKHYHTGSKLLPKNRVPKIFAVLCVSLVLYPCVQSLCVTN